MKPIVLPRFLLAVLAFLFSFAAGALAGPPLICHPIEIGNAKSLPVLDWNATAGTGGYDLKNLTRDTLAILDSDQPVLVRMETLRRATIYARHDPEAAKELFSTLRDRATRSDASGRPDALAWFDAGYLAATYQQWLPTAANPAAGLDGYTWIRKAIQLREDNAEMEFAAALVTINGPEGMHRQHVQKAIAGARNDALLARNLASRFRGQIVSEMLTHSAAREVAR